MRARYVGSLLLISPTTTDPERTYPWGKTHPKRARFNHPKSGRSWPFAKRVDCTIAPNDEQPEYRVGAHDFYPTVPPPSTASVLARPPVLRFCAQIGYSSRSPCHGSHGKPAGAPNGIFVRYSGLPEHQRGVYKLFFRID